jgi:glyoxylase-like metal-dependent hydrolase (beta-lactamase superfamily II)
MSAVPTIHRFPVEHEGAFVNAYLVETASGVVAVDGLLQVSAAKEMRAGLDALGKPLLAALLTHSHPDHYAGLGEIVAGADVPIYAPQGVIDTITADDALKDQIVGPFRRAAEVYRDGIFRLRKLVITGARRNAVSATQLFANNLHQPVL